MDPELRDVVEDIMSDLGMGEDLSKIDALVCAMVGQSVARGVVAALQFILEAGVDDGDVQLAALSFIYPSYNLLLNEWRNTKL